MKKLGESGEIKSAVANKMANNTQKTPEEKVAEQINQLTPETRLKLLLAEDKAQKQGDHRSILDPNKYFALLMQVDPSFMITLQKQVQELTRNIPSLTQAAATASDNPEKLADMILTLCGLTQRGDFLGGELQANYPNMNKTSLVKLGAKNLYQMIMDYIGSLGNPLDNRTALARFDKLMKEIGKAALDQQSKQQPPK